MKQDIQHIMLAAAKPLFLIFILYILKIMEVGMDWDFSRLGATSAWVISSINAHPRLEKRRSSTNDIIIPSRR